MRERSSDDTVSQRWAAFDACDSACRASIHSAYRSTTGGGLFRPLDGPRALEARRDAVAARQDASWAASSEQEPDPPEALRVRTADGFDVKCEERTRDGRWCCF